MAKTVYGFIYRRPDLGLLQFLLGPPLESRLFLYLLLKLGKNRYMVGPKP